MDTLLGDPMHAMHDHLETTYNDGQRHVLHYVTSREMYNIIKAAEAGMQGNPARYRDFELPPPPGVARWTSPALSPDRATEAVADIPGME